MAPRQIALALIYVCAALAQLRPQVTPATVIVETLPGAAINLEGKRIGVAGSDGKLTTKVAAGTYVLRAEIGGRRPFERKFTVTTGQTIRIQAELAPFTGSVQLHSTPGARVSVDDKPAGQVGADGGILLESIEHGDRTIRVSRDGHAPLERRVRVRADETAVMELHLEPIARPAASSAERGFGAARVLTGPFRRAEPRLFEPGSQLRAVAFTTDSRNLIAASNEPQVVMWDVATARQTATARIYDDRAEHVALSSDGRLCAAALHQVVRLWDTATAKNIADFNESTLSLSFSPDARRLIIDSNVWDVASKEVVFALAGVKFGSASYSPDGRWIARGHAQVTLHNAATGELIRVLESGKAGPNFEAPVFSPDSQWIAVPRYHSVHIWRVSDGQASHTLTLSGTGTLGAKAIAFGPDGRTIAAAGKGMRLWAAQSGNLTQTFAGEYSAVAFSPDGQWLAAAISEHSDEVGVRLWRKLK
jgi:hypothetical protein